MFLLASGWSASAMYCCATLSLLLAGDAASPTWFLGVNGGSNDPDSSSGEEFGYSLAGLNAGVEFQF